MNLPDRVGKVSDDPSKCTSRHQISVSNSPATRWAPPRSADGAGGKVRRKLPPNVPETGSLDRRRLGQTRSGGGAKACPDAFSIRRQVGSR